MENKVWCKFLNQCVFISDIKPAQPRAVLVRFESDIDADCNYFPVPSNELEDYVGQDLFGKEQILTDGKIIVKTLGFMSKDDKKFEAVNIFGSVKPASFDIGDISKWKNITEEVKKLAFPK